MKARKCYVVLFLLSFLYNKSFSFANTKNNSIAKIAKGLNWKSVLLFSPTRQINQARLYFEESNGVKLTWFPQNNDNNCESIKDVLTEADSVVIVASKSDFDLVTCIIKKLPPFRVLLIVGDCEKWFAFLEKFDFSSGLYLLDDYDDVLWSLITMRGQNHLVRNRLDKIDGGDDYATEKYNLQGKFTCTVQCQCSTRVVICWIKL